MSEAFVELGYEESEPDTPLMNFLRDNPEFISACKEHGWWLDTITKLEKGRES